jgi:hypothetical protein
MRRVGPGGFLRLKIRIWVRFGNAGNGRWFSHAVERGFVARTKSVMASHADRRSRRHRGGISCHRGGHGGYHLDGSGAPALMRCFSYRTDSFRVAYAPRGRCSLLKSYTPDVGIRRAIQVFGRPSSQRAVWPGFAGGAVRDCEVTWSWLGLRVLFTTLDIEPGACNPNRVIWIARVTGHQWRTWRGLRVGDRYSQIRAHHPRASLHHGIWWLATFRVRWGNRSLVPTVTATTRAGRVNGFGIWVQAQGE